jgi:predicted transcriptional regulator
MDSPREFRSFSTQDVISAFARQGVAIATISRAIAVPESQVNGVCRRAFEKGDIAAMPPERTEDVRGAAATELANLRERVETLEFILRETETKRSNTEDLLLGVAHMSRTESQIMAALLDRGRASRQAIYSRIYGNRNEADQAEPKIVDVMICKLRKKLKVYDVEVNTIWGYGYELDAENARKLRAIAHAVLPVTDSPPLCPADDMQVAA